tara:strand:- start:1863 stop:1991 length:129 start_codon:yes stop_codon:yes gene_type:complete
MFWILAFIAATIFLFGFRGFLKFTFYYALCWIALIGVLSFYS